MATFEEAREIPGLVIVTPDVHLDVRGLFVETYRRSWFPNGREMLQANRADRRAGSAVGLHFHRRQADYWYVPFGRARIVLHDLRVTDAASAGTVTLDLGARPDGEHDHRGVFIPPGVAHGFAAITDVTLMYLVDAYYDPADELGVAWDDPAIGADWGVEGSVLSERDRANPRRDELDLSASWRA